MTDLHVTYLKINSGKQLMSLMSWLVSLISGEWMLSRGRPNGGDVVIFRTLWVGTILIVVFAGIKVTAQPITSVCGFVFTTWTESLSIVRSTQGPVVYGAVYAALYARFTSQWSYMANLYNQIKQAEITAQKPLCKESLAQWKAGYIEDAYVTHMATKPMVAGVIHAWHSDPDVKDAFTKHTADHRKILNWLAEHKVL